MSKIPSKYPVCANVSVYWNCNFFCCHRNVPSDDIFCVQNGNTSPIRHTAVRETGVYGQSYVINWAPKTPRTISQSTLSYWGVWWGALVIRLLKVDCWCRFFEVRIFLCVCLKYVCVGTLTIFMYSYTHKYTCLLTVLMYVYVSLYRTLLA